MGTRGRRILVRPHIVPGRPVTPPNFYSNSTQQSLTCPDVFDDVGDPQHELILNGRNPGIVVQLEDGSGAEEVQGAQGGGQDGQPVALQVQLTQTAQLSNLLYRL